MYHTMAMELVDESGATAVRFSIDNESSLLRVDDVDALIAKLVQLRSTMKPAHPLEPVRAQNYPLEVDPCWHVDRSPLFAGPVLLLRHGGVGWTAFVLPPPSASHLVKALSSRFDIASSIAPDAGTLMN
ncbi:hypothetical protein [Paraburkholderia sp.]|uniref:hypothetical protein n=1 Tax=Paraburkholderia sp. TaxID=1926495 RepID=UPI003D6F9FA3